MNKLKNHTLYYLSATYPYGLGESYFELELKVISQKFDQIHIIPAIGSEEIMRFIPSNANVTCFKESGKGFNIKNEFLALRIMFREFIRSRTKLKYLANWRTQRALFMKANSMADFLDANFNFKEEGNIFYSLWMNDWALALAILKVRGRIGKFSFRVNGFDIYDERSDLGFIPFRNFIYSKCNKIYTVSHEAKKYIDVKYGMQHKTVTAHFGTEDIGISSVNHLPVFRILSCSRLVPLKNVIQIAKVVANLDFPVEWMHHGDGPELSRILMITETFPKHIRFIHSSMTNSHMEALMKQKEFSPDVFISLSTTEGLPVTFINVLSMGVPIISTDVGGCKEVVNEITGVLLAPVENDENVIDAIKYFRKNSEEMIDRRIQIRKFWLENFMDQVRYEEFANHLIFD